METSTLTRKGQTTIPKAIREQLKLKPGDRIGFSVEADGRVHLVPKNLTFDDLQRVLPKPKRKLPGDALDEAIRESWGARWRRFERQPASRKRRAS